MRMVLPQHLTHDASTLAMGTVREESHVMHGVEDTAVHGLEPISHVGQGTSHDHAHGIVQIGPLHLLSDIDGLYSHGAH
jgi:hypothetical protein